VIDGAGDLLGGLKGLARGSRRPRPSLEGRRASRRGSRLRLREEDDAAAGPGLSVGAGVGALLRLTSWGH